MVRPVRILPICLSVAAAAPFANLQAIIDTARVSVWIFALDDLFDEMDLPQAELVQHANTFANILRGRPETEPASELSDMLMIVKARLASYPLYEQLGSRWQEALIGTIEAMLQENEWRLEYQEYGAAVLPSSESYLECGRKSVGGPPHMWAAILTANDESAVSHTGKLRTMIDYSSSIVRLANDLQTYERELREGKLNSLIILSNLQSSEGLATNSSLNAARLFVRSQITEFLARLNELNQSPGSESGMAEIAVIRIAQYVAEFYQEHDFHTAMLMATP